MEVYDFKDGGGVGMAMYNTDEVIASFSDKLNMCLKSNPVPILQCFIVNHGFRSQLYASCSTEKMASLHEHQEHDHEEIRRKIQGHFRRHFPKVS